MHHFIPAHQLRQLRHVDRDPAGLIFVEHGIKYDSWSWALSQLSSASQNPQRRNKTTRGASTNRTHPHSAATQHWNAWRIAGPVHPVRTHPRRNQLSQRGPGRAKRLRLAQQLRQLSNYSPQPFARHVHGLGIKLAPSRQRAGNEGQLSTPEQNAIVAEAAGPSPHLLPASSKAASGTSKLSVCSS